MRGVSGDVVETDSADSVLFLVVMTAAGVLITATAGFWALGGRGAFAAVLAVVTGPDSASSAFILPMVSPPISSRGTGLPKQRCRWPRTYSQVADD